MPQASVPSNSSSQHYRVTNPATGAVVEEFPTATDAQIQDALARSEQAFSSWRQVPITERAAVVSRIAELFEARKEELAAIITEEMGKRLAESVGEAEYCAEIFSYYAQEGPSLAADQPIKAIGGAQALIQKRPIGPLLGIMPWNYPYYQVARFAAPNLVLGNTIILKHAENCPRSALAIEQLMLDAGLPAGAYINLFASHAQIETIISDPRVQGVSLTGSERAGAAVAQIAGRNLKKVVLELGGSDPYIVLASDDVKASAQAAFQTRMENAGQACNSNKRIIVMDSIHDEFVQELTDQAAALTPGNPVEDDAETYVPLSSEAAVEGLLAQINDAVSKGATLHSGGVRADQPGYYLAPTVLSGVTPEMRAFSEELFGPVVVVYKVSNDAEAVALANNSDYGLGGAVFSPDGERALAVAQQIISGMVAVNAPAGEGAGMPFGGVKRSGFGRELGPLGMEEFVNKQLLYVAQA
ncbi:NAD-dependent succinate-semialdehyde dehydrogenase [Arthrobacter glacialis]|uniref:NAD-dependent succinate-semialdehyde dehydrogenase n=1 Tax=Arthrobacter glacialis TaxID=1664 RepID=UPI000CD47E91|nr:NAD-dependent succinate-semialdehyde dehydrogenase [Arthrobacter glacialis]POH61172.1 succinate-semialdehyde dehydrogenase [Arthrobacter glacialis]